MKAREAVAEFTSQLLGDLSSSDLLLTHGQGGQQAPLWTCLSWVAFALDLEKRSHLAP